MDLRELCLNYNQLTDSIAQFQERQSHLRTELAEAEADLCRALDERASVQDSLRLALGPTSGDDRPPTTLPEAKVGFVAVSNQDEVVTPVEAPQPASPRIWDTWFASPDAHYTHPDDVAVDAPAGTDEVDTAVDSVEF